VRHREVIAASEKWPAHSSGPLRMCFFRLLETELQPEHGLPSIARETHPSILEVR
jgi:hypothetical protein